MLVHAYQAASGADRPLVKVFMVDGISEVFFTLIAMCTKILTEVGSLPDDLVEVKVDT